MKRLLAYLFIVLGLGLTFSVSANSKTYSGPTDFIEEFNEKKLLDNNHNIKYANSDKNYYGRVQS